MEKEGTSYIYGSAARELERPIERPYYNDAEEFRRRQQQRKQIQRRPKRKQKLDKVSLLITMITFAAVMVVGVSYIHLQFQSTYLSKNVVKLKKEVVNMEKENRAALVDVESSVNLEQIYEKATKKLGMKEATDDQIYTYKSQKSTQVRQHGSIPSE